MKKDGLDTGRTATDRNEAVLRYGDIIGLPHPEPDPQKHPRMSVRDRAAQFAPFAALTGFGDVIGETARREQGKWDETPE